VPAGNTLPDIRQQAAILGVHSQEENEKSEWEYGSVPFREILTWHRPLFHVVLRLLTQRALPVKKPETENRQVREAGTSPPRVCTGERLSAAISKVKLSREEARAWSRELRGALARLRSAPHS